MGFSSRGPPGRGEPTTEKKPISARRAAGSPARSPLLPSEKDNGPAGPHPRKSSAGPKARQVSSRYLLSTSSSTSSSSSSSSSSASSLPSARRCASPSPLASRPGVAGTRPRTPRAQSAERRRPSTPAAQPTPNPSPAARTLWASTTRSLSVSFQGESFALPISKQKNPPAAAVETKTTPDRQRRTSTPLRESSRPRPSAAADQQRWPPRSHSAAANLLNRSLDFTAEKAVSIRASLVGAADLAMSDTESVSSGSNSGAPETPSTGGGRATPRGLGVSGRFWPSSSPTPGISRKVFPDNSSSLPSPRPNRGQASPLRRTASRPASPSKVSATPSPRGMPSPTRSRPTSANATTGSLLSSNSVAPSFLNFSLEARKGRMGEGRIEDVHLLRILHNRQLQWRFTNAKSSAALSFQRIMAERYLYNAWVATSELRSSVAMKKIHLQLWRQKLKLSTILHNQMSFLEEWAVLEPDHSIYLSGAIEDLKASTLRLPITEGAKADTQKVKDAVSSAVDVMQAMGSSICSLLSKVEGVNSLVAELARVAAREQALLARCKDLLASVAAMQVEDSSLRTHVIQVKHVPRLTRL